MSRLLDLCSWYRMGVVDLVETQALPHTLAASGLARRFITSRAAGWPAELLELVILLTSELVTNAVLHGRGPVELRMSDDGARVRVEISDGDPAPLPAAGSQPSVDRPSGRGLLIVDTLSDRWGCRQRRFPPGKTVWFELRRPSGN